LDLICASTDLLLRDGMPHRLCGVLLLCGNIVFVQNKFNVDIDVRTLRLSEKLPVYTSANHQSLGELFCGFLKYYSHEFRQAGFLLAILG